MIAKNQESATESHSLEVLHTVTHLQRKANVHLKLMCEYQRKPVVLGNIQRKPELPFGDLGSSEWLARAAQWCAVIDKDDVL